MMDDGGVGLFVWCPKVGRATVVSSYRAVKRYGASMKGGEPGRLSETCEWIYVVRCISETEYWGAGFNWRKWGTNHLRVVWS
jgi:hypothetical protein